MSACNVRHPRPSFAPKLPPPTTPVRPCPTVDDIPTVSTRSTSPSIALSRSSCKRPLPSSSSTRQAKRGPHTESSPYFLDNPFGSDNDDYDWDLLESCAASTTPQPLPALRFQSSKADEAKSFGASPRIDSQSVPTAVNLGQRGGSDVVDAKNLAPRPEAGSESVTCGTLPPQPDNSEVELCEEQQDLVDLIASGRNVFYTGSAGCGKSTVLKAALKRLQGQGMIVHVVAPTGRAALQVNGTSTWSYMGWTPDQHKLPIDDLISLGFRKNIRRRLMSTDVLIIDEISMVENHHFERMSICMKQVRRYRDPSPPAFGGVQVVVTGDFCQLPPVKPFQHCIRCGLEMDANALETEFDCPNNHGPYQEHEKWAFESDAWDECNFTHVHLRQIHRQSDKYFIELLQKCRLGLPLRPDETMTLMDHPCDVTNATRLFSTRSEVSRTNSERFDKLRTPILTYKTLDGFVWNRSQHPHLAYCKEQYADGSLSALRDHALERHLELRAGMLVVLQVNLDIGRGLCNGSQGIVCGFEKHDPARLPKAKSRRGGSNYYANSEQGPLVKRDNAALKEEQVLLFIKAQNHDVWPRVRFHNGEKRTIYAECVVNSVGDGEPYSLLHRTQVPLTAAWAMSIHKSQGMTLDRVVVDLTRAFEEGQVYVALSRATSLQGLKVEGNPNGLLVGRGGNPQVQWFMRQVFGLEQPEKEDK